VFQYFDRQEAPAALAEWRRVLKPGGVLRLAVPELPVLVKVYEMTGNLDRILGPLFGRMALDLGGGAQQVIHHKTTYDFESLERVLREAGFADAHRYDWRQTIHKDYDDHSQAYFPHMDKDGGLLISLNVEATRR
jgi:predicted SAM-dependent methyltransferase